jgi:hypothetical protein
MWPVAGYYPSLLVEELGMDTKSSARGQQVAMLLGLVKQEGVWGSGCIVAFTLHLGWRR